MNQKLLQANIKDASLSLCELLDIYSLTEERVARIKSLHDQIINEIDGIHDDGSAVGVSAQNPTTKTQYIE